MGHRLIFAGGEAKTIEEIASELASVFEIFAINKPEGRSQAQLMVKKLKELNAPCDILQSAEESVEFAALITVGKNFENGCIQFLFIPGQEMHVGYTSQANQDEATEVTEKVAQMLGYDCTLE